MKTRIYAAPAVKGLIVFLSLQELPLDQINTTQVLILSYQRCGSTFVADMLFDHNPEAFYVYEPLDAVYTFMYGVEPGYSVPSSIYITSDGQHRLVLWEMLPQPLTLILLVTTIGVFNLFISRPNHIYWEWNVCLNMKIDKNICVLKLNRYE